MCIYDVYGPCSCPHGRCFTALAQCFTISSWISSLTCITSCYYIYVRPIPEEGQPEMPREGFGYISRQAGVLEPPNYRQCAFYTKDEMDEYFASDGMWRAGKAMSLLATGIGFIAMCIVICTCCVAFQLPTFDALFWVCMFCFVAQSLTFLAWGSDLCDEYECTWSSGTGMNITAAMFWVWAANMIKSFPEALPPRGRGRRKAPLYGDYGDDEGREFQDEYEDEWRNNNDYDGHDRDDGDYYDDDYGESYYDDNGDPYDDSYDDNSNNNRNYNSNNNRRDRNDEDNPEGYLDQDGYNDNDGYVDPYGSDPNSTDYDDPSTIKDNRYKQGRDDEFEPNDAFSPSWKEGAVDDASLFDSQKSGNAFPQSGSIEDEERKPLAHKEEEDIHGID